MDILVIVDVLTEKVCMGIKTINLIAWWTNNILRNIAYITKNAKLDTHTNTHKQILEVGTR